MGCLGLRARDAEALSAYYQRAVGLRKMAREGDTIWLGAGGTRRLALAESAGLQLAGPQQAGLFHTAFLLPSRRDLANWISLAVQVQLPVSGPADHRVSEAIYLIDPEGNGIEIYVDRPQDSWQWIEGQVQMGSSRSTLKASSASWAFCALLYKSSGLDPSRMDVICLFVQPLSETEILAHMFMSMLDEPHSDTEMRRFQQVIFGQDKPILESHRPRRLPLDPRVETPIRADLTSIAYRRWLSDLGVTYGVIPAKGPAA